MPDEPGLHALLTRHADAALGHLDPPTRAALVHRARRRRAALLAPIATVMAVVLIVAIVVVLHDRRVRSQPAAHPPVSLGALEHYAWRTMPAAPIATRGDAAAVWTGHEFLVWGGHAHGRAYADGAAYDPATRSWRVIAPSPLSPRYAPAHVWTGRELFVWGGEHGSERLTDGAVYDPAKNSWSMLPPAPVASQYSSSAYLVRGTVIVVAEGEGRGPSSYSLFDPATNSWRQLPRPLPPRRHGAAGVIAVSLGDRLLVWVLWEHTVRHGNEISGTSGIDTYVFDPTTSTWQRSPMRPFETGNLVLAGDRIVVPVEHYWCGACLGGPFVVHPTGRSYDVRTGKQTRIATDPRRRAASADEQFVWTGAVLVGVGGFPHPSTVAWSPASNTWTGLPAPPIRGVGLSVVWTGSRLIVWGPPRDRTTTSGAEFAPPR
jgi:hypothetical protein